MEALSVMSGQSAAKPGPDLLRWLLWGVAAFGVAAVVYIIVQATTNPVAPGGLERVAKGEMAALQTPAEPLPAPVTTIYGPEGEPLRLAETVERMDLRYAVITSVHRDDLPDGGAFIFAQCIQQIRRRLPECKVEVLIPDFCGDWDALGTVMAAAPDTLNHNIETVRRVFRRVRPKGDYDQSLELLSRARNLAPGGVPKSGMMVGLGETWDEIVETMRDLRSVDCDLLTIGQ